MQKARISELFYKENYLINTPRPFVTIFKKDSSMDVKIDLEAYLEGCKMFNTNSGMRYILTQEDEEAVVEALLLRRSFCKEEILKIDQMLEKIYENQKDISIDEER